MRVEVEVEELTRLLLLHSICVKSVRGPSKIAGSIK